MTLKERLKLSPEEKKRRYQQAVRPFVEKNFKNGVVSAENYIGTNDSPTAGLTKENFARSTEGYAANNDGTYRYRATRELGIADQIDQNPVYAAKDRMQYYLIDNPNAFDSPRELKTANDYWGQIYTVMSKDSVQGNALAEQAKYFSTQYGNPLYNPYQTSTLSKDIKNLFGLESFSKEWVAENYNLLNSLEFTAAGNPKAPSDKSTPEQILAYHYSKILDAEANTLKAEQELADLKAQISSKVANAKLYKTGQSVDDIYKSLEMGDYTTLKAMEDSKLKAQPYTLTRAVNYNDDVVYAMIQAAMDADDSDISGITDFTQAGAAYSNNKYVDAQEKRAQLYQKFYEDERERYRQEQDAVLTGDTSVQDKYKAREIAQPETNAWNSGVFDRVSEPKESGVKNNEPVKASSWADVDFANPNNVNLSAKAPEVSVGAVPRNNANSKPNAAISPVQTITERPGMATMPGMERYQMVPYMDQKEVEEYNRIFDSEGLNAADEYYYSISETLNRRAADQKIEELSGNRPAQVMYGFINGLVSTGEGWAQMLSSDVRPDSVSSIVSQAIKEESGDVADTLYDVTTSLGAMAPSILLSVISGNVGTLLGMGAKAASTLGQVVAGVSTLFSSGGNAYNEVMKSGEYSVGQAKSYATLVGASEALLSYALSGISALGGKLWGKVGATKIVGNVAQTIKHTDNVFLRIAGKGLLPAVEEGTEEWVQAAIEPVLKNAILGTDEDMNPFSEDALYSAFLGAITGGLLESGPSAIEAGVEVRNEREIGRDIIETGKRDRLIQAAKQSNSADVRQAAEALEAGTVRATEGMIGQLAIEYKDAGGDTSFLTEPIEPEVQPTVESITTDYDSAQALTRAMRGEVTESDLDLLEKSLSIPNHEDTVNEISAAAKEFAGINKRYTDKENQLLQLQEDIESAKAKVDEAKSGLSMHLRGVVRIQNGEVLGRELIAKHHIESEIQKLEAESENVKKSGLEPEDQNNKLDILRQQLSDAQTKVDELTAGSREGTAFQGQITNAQKALDAANRNYSVAEAEMDRIYYEYRAAANDFRNRVSNAVNTAFGQNALSMLEQTAKDIATNNDITSEYADDIIHAIRSTNSQDHGDTLDAWDDLSKAYPDLFPENTDPQNRDQVISDVIKMVYPKTSFYLEERQELEKLHQHILNNAPSSTDRNEAALIASGQDAYTQNADTPGADVREIEGLDYSVSDGTIPFNQQPAQQQNTNARRGKPLSLQMVIQQASSDFEIPARSGVEASFAGVPDPVKAYYNSGSASMRLPQDLWNFTHELGHYLNRKYKFSTKHEDMASAMTINLPNQFYEAYTNDKLKDEAVAELVRLFVVNEANAEQFGGSALDTLMKEMSYSDRRKLRKMQGRVQKYMAQTVDEINRANSSRSIVNMDQRTADAKVRDTLREMQYGYVDNLEAAARLDRQAQKELGYITQDKHTEQKFANYRRGNAIAANILTDQLVTPDGALVSSGFMSTLDGLTQKQYAELSQYLADMRAIDWLNHTETQTVDGIEQEVPSPRYVYDPNTTTEADIQNRINNTSSKVKAAADKVWDWFKNFEQIWLVDSGRMSQKDFDSLWKAEPHYVPLRRVIDYTNTSAQAINRGLEQISNQIIGVEGNGSSRDFNEPLTALMQSVVNITNGTLRNEVGKTLAWQLRNTETLGNMATITPFSKSIDGLGSVDAQEGILEKLTEMRPDGTNLYGVVENGKVTWLQINDPLLQQLMDNPNPQGVTGLLAKIGKGTNLANALATTYSTKFGFRNVIRDYNTAWRNSPTGNPLSFLIDEAVSIAEVAKNTWHTSGEKSQNWLEWAAAGGLDDGRFSQDISGKSAEKIYNLANPNKFKKFFGKINETYGILESATRLNLYNQGKKYALAEGQSDAAARAAGARLSREGTTDFNRRGAKMAGFSQLFRFGNASLQGAYQSIRALTDSSTAVTNNNMQRRWAKAGFDFVLRSAYLAALSMAFMDKDEKEQFRRMDPSVKYSGYVIPWSHISGVAGDIRVIPYPNDPVSALMSVGTAIVEGSLTGGVWDEVKGALGILRNSLIPVSSPIWSPIWEAGKNTTWYGGKIIPSNLENRPVLRQYDEDTTIFSRTASGILYNLTKGNVRISPMKIDYVLDQYGAAAFDTAKGLTEGLRSLADDEVSVENRLTQAGKDLANSLISSIVDGFKRNMISASDVSSNFYEEVGFLNEVISEQNQGAVHYDLAGDLSDSEIQQAYADAKSIINNRIKPIQEEISKLYDEMNEVDADQTMDDAEKERQKGEIRLQIYDLQLSGIAYADDFRAKYCGDSVNVFVSRETEAVQSKGYFAFNNESLPQGIRDQAGGKILTKMRSFYERDTNKTTFTPKYPPNFVDNDNVLTAWESVDSQTKTAMERAWTDAYMTELANNGFATVTDYDTAKSLASKATSKANAAAKEIYSIKYGFKE